MKVITKLGLVVVVFLFCRCKDNTFRQVSDDDLVLQVKALPGDQSDGSIGYSVRIIPGKKLLEKHTNSDSLSKMEYQMDSCFYLKAGTKNIYPMITQAISNGVKDSYEYMIDFDFPNGKVPERLKLVYRDKFLNRKTYTIELD